MNLVTCIIRKSFWLVFISMWIPAQEISAQYINDICTEGIDFREQERGDEALAAIKDCLKSANTKEDSLLLELNLIPVYTLLKRDHDRNELSAEALLPENEKYYKSYTLALELQSKPYMFKDKNLYLESLLEIDSIVTYYNYKPGILRSSTNLANAYYTVHSDYEKAYDYFIKSISYENFPDKYYISTVAGAYDTSCKLNRGNQDSIFALAETYISHKIKSPILTTDSSGISSFYGIVGSNYLNQGELQKALKYCLQATDYKPKSPKFQYSLLRLYFNIARIFQSLSNYDKAHEYTDLMQAIVKKNNYKSKFKDIAALRGSTYIKEGRLEEAKRENLTFLKLEESARIKAKSLKITALSDLTFIYIQQDSLVLAKKYLRQAQQAVKNSKETFPRMNMQSISSNFFLKSKKYKKALDEANKLLTLSREANNVNFELIAQDYIAQASNALKEYDTAYIALSASRKIQDSIFRAEQNYLVHDMEAKYQKKEKDLEIKQLNSDNLLNQERLTTQRRTITLGGIGLICISLLSYFLFRQRTRISNQNGVISSALEDKELLLKEIHHRVKNNLQVVSSLLSLQSEYIKDDNALNAINEGRNRVRSMALIHQNLYSEDNLTGINVKSYLEKLIRGLFDTYNIAEDRIKLNLEISDLELDVDTVIPLGLIANELVSNALKHAFNETEDGRIYVSLDIVDDNLQFIVSDSGSGIQLDEKIEDLESFGFQMIHAFVQKMNGSIHIENEEGTKIILLLQDFKK